MKKVIVTPNVKIPDIIYQRIDNSAVIPSEDDKKRLCTIRHDAFLRYQRNASLVDKLVAQPIIDTLQENSENATYQRDTIKTDSSLESNIEKQLMKEQKLVDHLKAKMNTWMEEGKRDMQLYKESLLDLENLNTEENIKEHFKKYQENRLRKEVGKQATYTKLC